MPGGSAAVSETFCILCGSVGGVDAVLNVLLFAPLGAGLALSGVPGARATLLVAFTSLLIESLQFSVVPGRDASLGDLLMNTMGGLIGFSLTARRQSLLFPAPGTATRLAAMWIGIWLSVQGLAVYSLLPRIPEGPYFGQHARDFGPGVAVFEGEVLSATIDTVSIPDWGIRNPRYVRHLLERPSGARVRAVIMAKSLSRDVAPIVRVAFGPNDGQLLVLGQRGADFVFGVRTGAEVLRLRPMRYRLPDVIVAAEPSTELIRTELEAVIARSGIVLNGKTPRTTSERRIDHRLSDAWQLFTPMQTYRSNSVLRRLTSSVWVALLVLPFGYSAAFATERSPRSQARAAILLSAVGYVAAWLTIPRLVGFGVPPWWEFVALVVGLLAGVALAKGGRMHVAAPTAP
jgi:hypothetical protein